MTRSLVAVGLGTAVVAVLWLACAGGGVVQEGIQADSLKALSALQSYEVQAAGELRQGETRAEAKQSYEFVAPDRLRFLSESTTGGQTDKAGLIIIGERSWTLVDGGWKEEPPLALDISVFSAERLWGLVPFDKATLREGLEPVNGVQARHYRADRLATLSFELMAGAFLAGGEPEFSGDLTHFTIDYWTDDAAGWPVRMELTATGGDRRAEITVDLAKANDASIQVEPP